MATNAEIKKVVVVGKYRNSDMATLVQKLVSYLEGKGCEVFLDNATINLTGIKKEAAVVGSHYDLVLAIGGDGTMMGACRDWFAYNIPLVGVNAGRIGFLTDLDQESMFERLNEILQGAYNIENREILEVSVMNGNEVISTDYAINDIVIGRTASGKLMEFMIFVNNEEWVNSQYSDGLIVSSPTGSTAYALAAGGPLIHPSSKVFAVVPICPQNLSNRPFVVPSDFKVKIYAMARNDVNWAVDGIEQKPLSDGQHVLVTSAKQNLKLVHSFDYSYFAGLRKKLNWAK